MGVKHQAFLLASFLLLSALLSHSALAKTISYEGYLTTPAGQPLRGDFDLTFRIYSGLSSSEVLWQEQQSVGISDGYFSVALGSVQPLRANLFSGDVFLGVEIGDAGELTPRTRLGAVPMAFYPLVLSDGVRIIPASGTPLENGTQLKEAIAELQPSQSPRGATIILEAGIYDLGTDYLDVTNTTLLGQGTESTLLTGQGRILLISGTPVNGSDDPSQYPIKIAALSLELFPQSNPGSFESVANFGYQFGEIELENIRVKMVSESPDGGCYGLNVRAPAEIRNVSIDVVCPNASLVLGFSINQASNVVVDISGLDVSVDTQGVAQAVSLRASAESVARNVFVHTKSADAHFGFGVFGGFERISDVSVQIDAPEDDIWYRAISIESDVVDISNLDVNVSQGGASYPYIFDGILYNYGVRIVANSGHVDDVRVRLTGSCDLADGAPAGTRATYSTLAFIEGGADDLLVVSDASLDTGLKGECSQTGVTVHTTSLVDFHRIESDVTCNTSLTCRGFRTVSMSENPESSGVVNHSSFDVENTGSGSAEAARLSSFSMDAFASQFISNKDSIVSFSVEGTSIMPSSVSNSRIVGDLQASNPLMLSLSELDHDPVVSNLDNSTCRAVIINRNFNTNSCL